MLGDERLELLFTLMSKLDWMRKERYRHGALSLLGECESCDDFSVIEHVLTKLKYCTSSDLVSAASVIAEVIQTIWVLDPKDALLVGVAEDSKPCGSLGFVRAIQSELPREWLESIFTNFKKAFGARNGKKSIVIADDFIGTGEKLKKKIDSLKRNPKTSDYKIHVVAFAGMEEGINALSAVVGGDIFVVMTLKKCISSGVSEDKAIRFSEGIRLLERKIFDNPGVYSFGYKQSEASFFLESYNMPNNNFPFLWWDKYADGKPRETLFTRR
ncbi:phosphoribosyltransferase-like protein [Iodobacter fluviatilis]|uniref:PRTase-CE domain-containing protein n=1 Tax=Iodobacter fluviatilis TaxID=537 RepID=A0A377QD04_9NEIS|nr:hypothetical protein [Iodobacter fluviatilis]TCU83731.1 hypothetical protein EV682_11194 [Iodobacter fluviatilis]STQ91761.1 Uncharacterised protein [Iodobacter fluviatilis]